jgi:hypothetical protein
MMPTLDIRGEELGENRTRLTLAYIECVMLWPDSPAHRDRGYAAAQAAHLHQQAVASLADATDGALPLSAADQGTIMNVLVTTPRLQDVQDEAKARIARGFIAGTIFSETLAAHRLSTPRKLQDVKADVVMHFRGKQHFEKMAPATVESTIWKPFAPVAHLWAASYLLSPAGRPFPCSLVALPSFLALSEHLRREGEGLHLKQAGSLLNPALTWSVPTALPLPELGIRWRRPGKFSKVD